MLKLIVNILISIGLFCDIFMVGFIYETSVKGHTEGFQSMKYIPIAAIASIGYAIFSIITHIKKNKV